MAANGHPKVFISYSWTSEAYKERVLKLAEQLVNDGVDVIIDRWDLRPGQDMYAFMEQSIKEAEKVLILCEKGYTEKADNRTGGVGTETEIITPDVYGKHKQEKFIPVIMETPKAVPSYLKSRYALYFTKDEVTEYRTLCRTIFGLSERKKPSLGKKPTWLEAESPMEKRESSERGILKPNQSINVNSDRIKPELGKKPVWLEGKKKTTGKSIEKMSVSGTSSDAQQLVTKTPTIRQHLILHRGDKYEFGHYPKQRAGKDEPLLWRVLDVDNEKGRALLITENLIDCRKYHEEWKDITWADCDLRKWLNGEFIDRAFDKEDLVRIAEMPIQNLDNTEHGTKGGRDTWDRVFELSIGEAEKYFSDNQDQRAAVTPYARSHGSYSDKDCTTPAGQPAGWWWLRSPGSDGDGASFVDYVGDVSSFRFFVLDYAVSVRPALWLNL